MRAVTEQDIKDLYHNRDNNHPKILTSYLANLWLKQRPKEIVSFLADICYLDPEKESDAYQLPFLIEHIYGCRNKRLVLPLSFRNNLLIVYPIVSSWLI